MGDAVAAPGGWVTRDGAVLWRRTLDGVVVLAPGEDEPQVLEPPGDVIWAALAEPVAVADLAAALAADYDAAPDVVRVDVERFVGELLERGLAVAVDEPG